MRLPAYTQSGALPAEAEEGWRDICGHLQKDRLRQELDAIRAAYEAEPSVENLRRLEALSRELSGEGEDLEPAA
ncbi:MAG: hypothetical protein JO212_12480 [Acetobacteraceae bacterium]|nr:hypothetical protein [Acetobacteraceae bacterium]